MHENLIYEGNTIYELDPECVRAKEKWEKEKQESIIRDEKRQRKQGRIYKKERGRKHLQDERMTGKAIR